MVKKRAVLSGQGKKLFFSEEKQPSREKAASVPEKTTQTDSSKSEKDPDLIRKIRLLKDLVGQFKKLTDSNDFKKMRMHDLKAYAAYRKNN